ncbi:CPBP family intramembrane glutamic endopeptidase [Haloarchaeobius amylolyticus]|uniref:CPBP family intramembrane glutamic endopeptidase n=1 Tax=Haloarchaeobius amylolyticus TaxID=1198296 RepID=UPI0026E53E3B|nr:CPBP family intramembrane glutamic endopeptidase [Haloarchaeobius amylolyticus]
MSSIPVRPSELTWTQKSLLLGAVLSLLWMEFTRYPLNERLVTDTLIFFVGPMVLAWTHGKNIGYHVDWPAVRNTVLLAAFVLPFYVVGSSLPGIRAYYPMWGEWTTGAVALDEFAVHAAKQFMLVVAVETYYRGLLCVGVGERFGMKAALISPFVYMLHHVGKPPLEMVLSGPTDVLFGAVDYKSDSLLPSIVAHGAGLVLLDWLVLHEPLIPPETVIGWLRWLPIPL